MGFSHGFAEIRTFGLGVAAFRLPLAFLDISMADALGLPSALARPSAWRAGARRLLVRCVGRGKEQPPQAPPTAWPGETNKSDVLLCRFLVYPKPTFPSGLARNSRNLIIAYHSTGAPKSDKKRPTQEPWRPKNTYINVAALFSRKVKACSYWLWLTKKLQQWHLAKWRLSLKPA